jgi:hypothetical protein
MRKIVLLASTILFTSSLSSPAQTAPTLASPLASCGDEKVTFDVSRGPAGSQATPEPGKATIYIIEISDLHDKGKMGRPLIRHAMDGNWIGATQGFTYIAASVGPGAHHLCSQWQSNLRIRSDQVSLNNFQAEAGRTYYFRLQIGYEANVNGGAPMFLDLQPVSDDEGILLVSRAAQSISKPGK